MGLPLFAFSVALDRFSSRLIGLDSNRFALICTSLETLFVCLKLLSSHLSPSFTAISELTGLLPGIFSCLCFLFEDVKALLQ